MQRRSFFLLLGVTMAFALGAIYAVTHGRVTVSPVAADERAFPALAAALPDLAWMRLSHGSAKTDFAAIGGHWEVVEKGNYPAAAAKVQRLLLGLADLTLIEPKTQRPELFVRLDLDDPATGKGTLVTLQDRLGKPVAELIVGKTRRDRLGGGNDAVYVRKPNSNQTWLARGSLDVAGRSSDWLDRRILDIAASRIASVTLTDGEGTALVLKRDAAGGRFSVADPPADVKFKGDAALAAPAAALAALDLEDVRPAAELPIPDSGTVTAAFATFRGLTITVRVFTHDNADWAAIAVTGSGASEAEGSALNDTLSRWVYALPPARSKLLRTRLGDLVEPPKGS